MKTYLRKNIGILLILLLLCITIYLWYLSKTELLLITITPYRSIGEVFGLMGIMLLSIDFLFPTRLKIVEKLFGNLDKVYRIHHIIGGLSFAILLNHPVFLVINSLPSVQTAMMMYIPWTDFSYDVGIFALYLMLILLFMTFYVKLPYHIWKMTHEYLSLVLLLGMIHVLLINSDTTNYLPLKIWIIIFISLGLLCFIYTRFLYKKFGPHYFYSLVAANQYADILELIIKPTATHMSFMPGQFVFLSVQQDGISREKHPFSISSTPDSPEIRLGIKCVGDFTTQLKQIQPGAKVKIYGPYGGFSNKFMIKPTIPEIWIAGGIGITPFISMLEYKVAHYPTLPITLFYAVRNEADAVYLDVLNAVASQDTTMKIIPFYSSSMGHLNVEKIQEYGCNIYESIVFLCGPKPMMDTMIESLTKVGVKLKNIQYEDFTMTP